jgi:RNA polymerase sigma-70 factor (ECF subfamily)
MTSIDTITEHYRKNFDNLCKKLSFRAGTLWDAEDAIHDAYERAIKYFGSFDPSKSTFGAWFNRIVVNAIKEHYNHNQGRNDVEFEEDMVDGVPCGHYADKVVAEIRDRIQTRKPHIAEILHLFFEKGYGAKDISRMVESSHIAVNQTIFRFREELRKDYRSE